MLSLISIALTILFFGVFLAVKSLYDDQPFSRDVDWGSALMVLALVLLIISTYL